MTLTGTLPPTLPGMTSYLEENGWDFKLTSRRIEDGTRRYTGLVWKSDELGGGRKCRDETPVRALASALVSARRARQARSRKLAGGRP